MNTTKSRGYSRTPVGPRYMLSNPILSAIAIGPDAYTRTPDFAAARQPHAGYVGQST